MAEVFLAVAGGPSGFSKLVVLKKLLPHLCREETAAQAFLEEARLAARINHPNVVQTFEVVGEPEQDYIVMEYLDGQSLHNIVKYSTTELGKPPPVNMLVRILVDVLEGLQYAHDLKDFNGSPLQIVHRDVSPQNVLVTFEGHVKVLDFGIAKAAGSAVNTTGGILKGKVGYMAPEHVQGEQPDRRADVFGVGIMLWEACAGRRLWEGLSSLDVVRSLLRKEIPEPVAPDEELRRIIAKAMAVDRELRYATALELQTDLDAYLKHVGSTETTRTRGRYVSELFKDSREKMRRVIEAQLAVAQDPTSSDYRPAEHESVPRPFQSLSRSDSAPNPASNESSTLSALAVSRPRFVQNLAIALVAFAAAAGLWLFVARSPSPALNLPAAATSPATASTPTARHVRLRVSASPASAHIFLDDQPLDNPTQQTIPADPTPHVLEVRLHGYKTRTIPLLLDRDSEFEIVLVQEAPAPPASSAAPIKPPAAKGKQRPRAPRKPDCSQPFEFDERGIKTLRAECR